MSVDYNLFNESSFEVCLAFSNDFARSVSMIRVNATVETFKLERNISFEELNSSPKCLKLIQIHSRDIIFTFLTKRFTCVVCISGYLTRKRIPEYRNRLQFSARSPVHIFSV